MTKYTTIRIKEDSRKKLEKIRQGTDLTFSDIIENLLQTVPGTTQQIEEIKRETIAISLVYSNFKETIQKYDITFHQLKHAKTGDMFYANSEPEDEYYLNTTAEVLTVDDVSSIVRIVEVFISEEGCSHEVSTVNVEFF